MSAQNAKKQSDVALELLKLSKAATDIRKTFANATELETSPVSNEEGETNNALLFSSFVQEKAVTASFCR